MGSFTTYDYMRSACRACWRKRPYKRYDTPAKTKQMRDNLTTLQHGVCALTGDTGRRLVLDHCPRTGKARGCVTHAANMELREDSPELRVIEYMHCPPAFFLLL